MAAPACRPRTSPPSASARCSPWTGASWRRCLRPTGAPQLAAAHVKGGGPPGGPSQAHLPCMRPRACHRCRRRCCRRGRGRLLYQLEAGGQGRDHEFVVLQLPGDCGYRVLQSYMWAYSLRAWLAPAGADLEALWASGDIMYKQQEVRLPARPPACVPACLLQAASVTRGPRAAGAAACGDRNLAAPWARLCRCQHPDSCLCALPAMLPAACPPAPSRCPLRTRRCAT